MKLLNKKREKGVYVSFFCVGVEALQKICPQLWLVAVYAAQDQGQ